LKKSSPPQRGGIFVEKDSRGSAPQRGAISLLSNRQFVPRLQLSHNAEEYRTPLGWGCRNARFYKYATPLGWRGFFHVFWSWWYSDGNLAL